MSDDAAERSRAHELLAHADLGEGWQEEAAIPEPASVGALDGFRLISADRTVRINVYVYRESGQGTATGEALTEMVDGDVYHAGSAVNGRLLCFAVASADSANGRRLVDEALAAMSG
jgi:hypothetical protein